jgi:uncharacterized protein with von Willebrand factor type A (vWA) domain
VSDDLPRELEPFLQFPTVLRANGFAVAPEQTQSFVTAIGLLGPRSMRDIRHAAHATFAPPPERREEFDALFRLVFLGQGVAAPSERGPEDEDELEAFDARDGGMEPPAPDEESESGAEATGEERLYARSFAALSEHEALRRFRRAAPAALPRRRSLRRVRMKGGDRFHMRRLLRDAAKRDGEVVTLPTTVRRTRQRRILLLIDVSGSMKERTDAHLRLAHSLIRAADNAEVFTLGTRLTRVSRALRRRDADQALAMASTLVADWDGGTRLGDALQAFLSVPRFAGFARGALLLIVSDGLERGDPSALKDAVGRLSRLAWRIVWLTPLMADADYRPETPAMQAVLPYLDRLGNAASTASLCEEILAQEAA